LLVFLPRDAGPLGLSVHDHSEKASFRNRTIGLISGTTEASQDISFAEMLRQQEALQAIVQADPAVATVGAVIGGNGPRRQ